VKLHKRNRRSETAEAQLREQNKVTDRESGPRGEKMSSQTGETRIKTNFLENQAKEVSDKKMSKGPMIAFSIIFIAGLGFGGFKVAEFLMNYQTIAMMKNIELILDSPTTKDGQATVDVVVRNNNPFPVKDFAFKYTIDGTNGGNVAAGTAKIDNLVPAADERKFAAVPLGAIKGAPAKMHVDLSQAVIAEKSTLPADVQMAITDALFLKEQDSVAAFEKLAAQQPESPVVLNALGLAYEECGIKDKAKEQFQKAIIAADAAVLKGGSDAATAASGATDNAAENAHYHLGNLLLDSDKTKAKAEFEAAAKLNPTDPAVQAALQKF
jgi:tetratricopeptide (TPR) repeat protein